MGLTDILTGMLNGPRGGSGRQADPHGGSGGGLSPITMALLALLAYKAIKGFGGSSSTSTQAPSVPPGGSAFPGLGMDEILKGSQAAGAGQPQGGGLGGLLAGLGAGGLGGLLAGLGGGGHAGAGQPGAGLGGLLTGGLSDLLDQFKGAGKGDAAHSWIGPGQNQAISAHELSQVLTPDQIDFLTRNTGLPRDQLLAGLSEQLPQFVDKLTPEGRLPTTDELDRA